jgi:hypothetical protein
MSSDDYTTVQTFVNWVRQGDAGLAGWINSAMSDPAKLQQIAQIYRDIRAAFGF